MSLTAPSIGDVLLLKYMLNYTASTNKVLRLYTNDPTTSDKTLTSSGVTEAAAAGYTPITLVGASWTFATVSNVTTASYSEVAFSFTTSASLYGYYVTSTVSGSEMLWIERFSGAPFTLPSGGGTIAITPKVTLN